MSQSGKFSLQWINRADGSRPMGQVRFNLRDHLSWGTLTCDTLHLDQVHVQFQPNDRIPDAALRPPDSKDFDWQAETLQLYVRITPGHRHTLYNQSDPVTAAAGQGGGQLTQRSLVYSSALSASPYTGATGGTDAYCRSYRPIRDLPVSTNLLGVSEIQVDLLWPLLQGGPANAVWWNVPDYRIVRVLCEFSFTTASASRHDP